VGIGQGKEIAPWTPGAVRRWLGRCRGVTVRDESSLATLLGLGLSPARVRLSSDSAFTLAGGYRPGPVAGDLLGFAPRNVSNRKRRLLPLETRKRLGIHEECDTSAERMAWAALLDEHLERRGGGIAMFPFHSGSLSNSDDEECRAVLSYMKRGGDVRIVEAGTLDEFMGEMSRCRVFVTVPLHGSILSVVTGALPVALPYASKGFRFMEEAGLGEFCIPAAPGDWTDGLRSALDRAWEGAGTVWRDLSSVRERMVERCRLNSGHFRATCLQGPGSSPPRPPRS
jgi:polysaccharide pyruvyl transferase WcaK-like protein